MNPRWHVTYSPGDWIVLAGSGSIVALDSRTSNQASLAAELWPAVDSEADADLVSQLAAVGVTRLPGLAVLFFERDEERDVVRALLRGDVRVLAESGQTVAHGADVLTWQEVRLADLAKIEVDLGGAVSPDTLPLVRGAARAGRLRLVGSPRSEDAFDTPAHGFTEAPTEEPVGEVAGEVVAVTTLPPDVTDWERPEESPDRTGAESDEWPETEDDDTLEGPAIRPSAGDIEAMESADTELIYLPPPAVARLRAPDGSTIDLDRPVLIGRAPSDSGFENAQPHLLTVPSPSQDISRTHLLVAPEGEAIVVTDLHSTNGTTVVRPGPGVERLTLPSGQSVTVEVGSVLELGDEVAILIDGAS